MSNDWVHRIGKILALEHHTTPPLEKRERPCINLFMIRADLTRPEELQMQMIETRKRVLRLEHPATLQNMGSLGFFFIFLFFFGIRAGWARPSEELTDAEMMEMRGQLTGWTATQNLASFFFFFFFESGPVGRGRGGQKKKRAWASKHANKYRLPFTSKFFVWSRGGGPI